MNILNATKTMHLKIVQVAHFMLHIFYHSFKKITLVFFKKVTSPTLKEEVHHCENLSLMDYTDGVSGTSWCQHDDLRFLSFFSHI